MTRTPDFPRTIENARLSDRKLYIQPFCLEVYPWLRESERDGWGWLYIVGDGRVRILSDADVQSNAELASILDNQESQNDQSPPLFHVRDPNARAIRPKRLQKTHISKGKVRVTIPSWVLTLLGLTGEGDLALVADSRGFVEFWTWGAVRKACSEMD